MNERNCFLIIDSVEESKKNSSAADIDFFLKNFGFELNEGGRSGLQNWCKNNSKGGTGLNLDMLSFTQDQAEQAIDLLARRGISARVQYHEIEENSFDTSSISINATDILADTNALKQYLKDLYTLEKNLYCSRQARDKAHTTLNQLGRPTDRIQIEGYKSSASTSLFTKVLRGIINGAIGYVVGRIAAEFIAKVILDAFTVEDTTQNIISIIIVVLFTLIGFGIGHFKASVDESTEHRKYDNSMKKISDENARIEKEKTLIPTYKENEEIYAQNVASCKEILDQLYSANIIFPKYRNLIAISQIYEYFMSGRCTELEGHEGAYNIFENELRQNTIIYQLNEVLANLEEIKRTQYMIYEAIQESNKILSSIENNTSAIAYNTAVIAENTTIIANYSLHHSDI